LRVTRRCAGTINPGVEYEEPMRIIVACALLLAAVLPVTAQSAHAASVPQRLPSRAT